MTGRTPNVWMSITVHIHIVSSKHLNSGHCVDDKMFWLFFHFRCFSAAFTRDNLIFWDGENFIIKAPEEVINILLISVTHNLSFACKPTTHGGYFPLTRFFGEFPNLKVTRGRDVRKVKT